MLPPIIRRFRERQINLTVRLLLMAEHVPGGSRLLGRLSHWRATGPFLNWLLGYRRVFDTLEQAQSAARPFASGGFANPDYAILQLRLAENPRPSDYAALFHMRGLAYDGVKIFDAGGNVGNLFYLYDRYLGLPPDCIWKVFDLLQTVKLGRDLAARRGERRLEFTDDWNEAAGANLLIASGSLHYFKPPLHEMVAKLAVKPAHILVNRTPLIEGPTKATVQDDGNCRVACLLYNRLEIVRGFEALGYEVVDSWSAQERFLKIAGRPESSAQHYSGFFLRLKTKPPTKIG